MPLIEKRLDRGTKVTLAGIELVLLADVIVAADQAAWDRLQERIGRPPKPGPIKARVVSVKMR